MSGSAGCAGYAPAQNSAQEARTALIVAAARGHVLVAWDLDSTQWSWDNDHVDNDHGLLGTCPDGDRLRSSWISRPMCRRGHDENGDSLAI